MKIAFIMDAVSTILVDEDTTYALMRAAQERGHEVYYTQKKHLELDGAKVRILARKAEVTNQADEPLRLRDIERMDGDDFHAIFVRSDPPFDVGYLWMTQILSLTNSLVINRPQALRDANEKLFTHHFADLMPKTLVSSNKNEILRYMREDCGGKSVGKPIDGHGGGGIFLLEEGSGNNATILETLTLGGTQGCVVQEFLPDVSKGDKRILLLDGEVLGAINRRPMKGEFRSNIHVGGSAEASTLDARDKEIVERVAPELKKRGLYFVGIDVVGGKLTEINVTSPTGIQQMSRFDDHDYSAKVVAWVEDKVK